MFSGELAIRRRVRETAANWVWGATSEVVQRRERMEEDGGSRRRVPRGGLLGRGMARFLRKERRAWRSWPDGGVVRMCATGV